MAEKDTYQKVHYMRNVVAQKFNQIWDDAEENARFYRMLQYSADQLRKATSQNRVPYVLDYVTNPMNTYLGDQRDQRADIVYLPVEQGDEVKVELLNAVKDATLRRNKFLFIESDIFQDGLIKKTGVLGYEWTDIRNPLGELRLFRIPHRQLTWDLSNRDYELSMGQWASRTRLYPRKELIRRKPEYKKEIENLEFNADDLVDLKLSTTYLKDIIDRDLGVVALSEFYEKTYKVRYFLVDKESGDIEESYYNSQKEADKAIKNMMQIYEQKTAPMFEQQGIQAPPPPSYAVKPHSIQAILKSEVSQSIVFTDEEETNLPDFPYDKYHPYFDEGEWWSAMDLFKDPQRFINKSFSQIDHQMSSGSKGLLMISDKIAPAQAKQIRDMWSKTGGMVEGIPNPSENVHFIPPTGFDARLLSAMELAVANVEKKAGGSNFMGQAEGADEAASAIRQRIMRASASSFIIFDNLTRWKQSVGEKIAWYLTTYMTASQKVRIEGEELTKLAQEKFPDWFKGNNKYGFLDINTTPINTIEGIKVDVIVDEAKHSVTKNQAVLEQLGKMMQASPVFASTIPPEMVLELTDLPASKKIQYMGALQEAKQLEAAKAQAEMNKPPTLSAKLEDITFLPVGAQAQFAEKFGINLNQPVENKNDAKTKDLVIKGKIDSLRQERDIKFKDEKHREQLLAKGLSEDAKNDIEREKIKKEKDAVQKP